MSWEEYKKKRQEKSSWEQYKQKRQDNISKNISSTNTATKNKTSLWEDIQNIANNIGRIGQNLYLGGKNGIEQSINYTYSLAENRRNSLIGIKNQRVLGSKELSDSDKALFLAEQKNKIDIKDSVNLPTINLPTNISYDKDKVDDIANNSILDKSIQKDQKKIQENIEQQSNGVTKKLAELAPSIGNMGVGAATSAVNPAVGFTYFTMSAAGSYKDDALSRGMTEEQAEKYGAIMGLMEGATETIGLESFKKAGTAIKTLISGGTKEAIKAGAEEVTKNSIKDVLKNYGIGIADNIIQEAIIEPISEITAGTIGGQDKADWSAMGTRMVQSGIDGGLTAAILGGAEVGIYSCSGLVEKIKNNKSVTQQEIQTAVQDASKQLDVEQMIVDSTQQQIDKYKTENTITNLQQNSANNQNITQEQQIIQIPKESSQNINSSKSQIIGYHGTDAVFDNFDLNYFGKHDQGDLGKAIYFSNNEQTASKYGKNIKQSNIELENPLVLNSEDDYQKLWNKIAKNLDKSKLNETEIAILDDKYTTQADKDFMLYDKLTPEEKAKAIQDLGYDGVIDNTYGQIAVFDTEKINNSSDTISNLQQNMGNNKNILPTQQVNITSQNGISEQTNKRNIIDAKVNEYITQNRDNFTTDINISTDIVNKGNASFVNYKAQSQRTIYNKAKELFSNIHRRVFKNNNQNIYVTNADISESINKTVKNIQQKDLINENLAIFSQLDKIIENAELISTESSDNKGRTQYTNYEYYVSKANIDGQPYIVEFDTRLQEGSSGKQERHFRLERVYKVNEAVSVTGTASAMSQFVPETAFINNSIPQNTKNVNGNTITNNYMQNAENNSFPFRASEEIANDTKISDLDAIKEESEKINMPTMEKANEIANQIGNNVSTNDNSSKSPTIDLVNKKRSKEKPTVKEIKDTLAQKFINKGHYIDKLAKETGNKNLTYLYDRTMNVFNEAQISIGDMQVITNESGRDVEVVGKSIIDIFSEADNANLSKEFDDYLLNKHNIARYAHEKGVFGKEISATDSQNIVNSYEAQHPEFIEWSKEVSAYNDNNLKDLVRNGLVSQETYDKLREMYSDYVPTFRDITDNVQQYVDDRVGNNTLGRATQSDRTILSVKESMAEQTLAIKRAIRVNNFGVELYKTLGKDSKVNESVSGIDFDPVAIQTLAGNVIDKATDGTNTFMIFKDGEMTQFKISDELYSAFSKDTLQNKINNNDVAKAILTPVEKLNKVQRELLTTYSIGFAFNNPIKDFQDALFNTKYSSTQFLKNYTKALYNIGTNGSWYENYKNNGGTANTYFDYDKGILPTKTNNLVKKFANKIKTINEVLEQAPRLAEYISTIENVGSIDEALYNAADITTNFKRGGDITKAMNKYGANFLNASVQGLDKFYRNLSGQNGWKGYARLLVKATIWQVAPAVLNGLLLGDDEDYEDLPEYAKDNYFLFKMENVSSILPTYIRDELTIDSKFFRIPKGRVSSVVGGIARRALETAQGKEMNWESLIDTTVNQMAPNDPFTDNLIAPIMQVTQNKTWYGGEIVNSKVPLPVAEQYDESTDELSKFLGRKLNISPKKINYVLDQYSGGIGDVILPMMTPQAENNILEDKFTIDSAMKNKHVSEFYSKLEELEGNKNSTNATDKDKLKYIYFSNNSKELGELYNQKHDIQNSDLSDKEKKIQVREVQKQINSIVENKLENVENLQISGDTAQVGDTQYYKYKGEWKELSEEEKEKTKGISLNTYANYQNKVAKISNQKKANDESITKKDKINILTSSNYSDSEKDKIYSQIIDKDDEVYFILKKLDNSKNIINQYLDYLQTDLKADREDDGTEKGKAISGSKKQKVYNYINSIDSQKMSYAQRLYLTGVNTTLNASDKKKIFSLINESKSLTQKEKLEALDKLQGFTVYTNGTVKY